ncbi:FkbM family methyltransferase [Alphaproteobacteria bacterium]|nr:FkbM family methyltransferase [Alphaproteobacteria bacterium]
MALNLLRLRAQAMIPRYYKTWDEETTVLRHWLKKAQREFKLTTFDGVPLAINSSGIRLHGIENTEREKKLIIKLGNSMPLTSEFRDYFRLLSDIVCRFYFPHLLPNLCPMYLQSPSPKEAYMEGFHGQHRDSVSHISNSTLRRKITKIFEPSVDDVIIDCGAYIGLGALAASLNLSRGKIFAVEPDQKCFEVLSRNITANKVNNIVPIQNAVWSESNLSMELASAGAQSNSLVPQIILATKRDYVQQAVITKSIDDLVAEQNLNRVDMISLTINGAEPSALKGADITLRNFRPRVRLAGWYRLQGKPIAEICREMLETYNYSVYKGSRNGVLAVPLEKLNIDSSSS